jgi:cellulose biosynthesis protein BcsQ
VRRRGPTSSRSAVFGFPLPGAEKSLRLHPTCLSAIRGNHNTKFASSLTKRALERRLTRNVFFSYRMSTMKDQTPDDVFALYSHYDLDAENYRVFIKPKLAETQSEACSILDSDAPQQDDEPVREPSRPRRVPSPESRVTQAEPEAFPAVPITHGNHRRPALQSLWCQPEPKTASGAVASYEQLASCSVSIHGLAGGVGVTTIAAVLARLLARAGRHCAVFTESALSILPIFFGGTRALADHRRFSGLRSVFQPSVNVVSREMFEPAGIAQTSDKTFIERNVPALSERFDHLIFDQPPGQVDSCGAASRIFVGAPDVNSVVGLKMISPHFKCTDTTRNAICVLNRFDPSQTLHRELLAWYKENFAEVLTISNSPLVPEALAEGLTVIDWAPRSSASRDLLRLYSSVSERLRSDRLPAVRQFDVTDFESEGVSLCQ